ncbi:MAG: glycosyltransferase family 2 protein [Thermodesulfobacteriota bacterium]|jgi:GT2 family glycosyltransferase
MKRIESAKTPQVSVIIVNWNGRKVLNRCLTALAAQNYKDFEVIVIDNGSSDGSVDGLEDCWPGTRVMRLKENRGFAAANNLGAGLAQGTWVALLNNDAFPSPGWLDSLVSAAVKNPEFTFFASCLTMARRSEYLDGMGDVYHGSGTAWRQGHGERRRNQETEPSEVFGPCAAAALYPRDIFIEIGGFDEAFFCYHEDIDLAFRLRLQGHRCLYVPEALVEHVGYGSYGAYSDFVLYYGHRNLIWTYFKNMPAFLFWRYLPAHLMVNMVSLFWFSLIGHGRAIWRAKWDALRGLPSILNKRRPIQRLRQASISEIDRAMNHGCLNPYLEAKKRWKLYSLGANQSAGKA